MGRRLQGTIKQIPGGWRAEVPTKRGANARTRHDFRELAAAETWRAAAIAALYAETPLPLPDDADLLRPTRPGAATRSGTAFRPMAVQWKEEYYRLLNRGQVDREIRVEEHIALIDRWMTERGLVLEAMGRQQVLEFSLSLSTSPSPTGSSVPDGLDPDQLVSMDEAVALPGTPSKSTLKRRAKDGSLPKHHDGEHVRYRVADLYTAEVGGGTTLKRGPKRSHGYAQQVITDILWVYDRVCRYARAAHDVAVPLPRDLELDAPLTDRPGSPDRPVVTLTMCAQMASGMHIVHQLALWLMRILGLRISEAFGPRVRHVVDNGPGQPGVLVIRRQGGKPMQQQDPDTGARSTVDGKDGLKTKASYRVLVVPPALMDLIRIVIQVFHTDSDGSVRLDARLLPGLTSRDRSGQAAFRSVLRHRAAALGMSVGEGEEEAAFSCRPHDMRYAVISDLTWKKVEKIFRMRFAGHAAGDDVHAGYVLDDPRLEPAHEVARTLQDSIEAELPGRLLVPTTVRCTTGNQSALAPEATRIDAELIEAGLLVRPGDPDDPLLSTEDGAQVLGVSLQTYRKWIRASVLPSVPVGVRSSREERRAPRSAVLRLADQLQGRVSLHELADQVGRQYHTVYQYVRAQGLELTPVGERQYAVPEETAERVRTHYRTQAELEARAMRVSAVAVELGCSGAVVERHLAAGALVLDQMRAHDGSRMVLRTSVQALEQQQRRPSHGRATTTSQDLLTWDDARTLTGLPEAALKALCADGSIQMVVHRRRRHVVRAGILIWLAVHHPERLQVAG